MGQMNWADWRRTPCLVMHSEGKIIRKEIDGTRCAGVVDHFFENILIGICTPDRIHSPRSNQQTTHEDGEASMADSVSNYIPGLQLNLRVRDRIIHDGHNGDGK